MVCTVIHRFCLLFHLGTVCSFQTTKTTRETMMK